MAYKTNKNLLLRAFPKRLADTLEASKDLHNISYWDEGYKFKIDGETIIIPYRAYSNMPPVAENPIIRLCISSRSTNGFMRQAAIESLLEQKELPNWAIAYLLASLGDYVSQISLILPTNLAGGHPYEQAMRQIVRDNSETIDYIRQRAISYWNEYYHYVNYHFTQRWNSYKEYPPVIFIDYLRKWPIDLQILN